MALTSVRSDTDRAAVAPSHASVQGEAGVWSQGALEGREKRPLEEVEPVEAPLEQGALAAVDVDGGRCDAPSPSSWPFPVLVPPESLGWKAASSYFQVAEEPLARPQRVGGVQQHKRMRRQQPIPQPKAAGPQEAFIEPIWQCATPGCELPDFHKGPCTSQQVVGPRQRRPSVRTFDSSTDGPALDPDDAALGPAKDESRKRKLPPSAAKRSARAVELSPEGEEGPSFSSFRVWPPSPELSASGRLALAAIARAQEKWSRAATTAQRGGWAAPVPAGPSPEDEIQNGSNVEDAAPAPAPAPAPGWKLQPKQGPTEAPPDILHVRPPHLGSAEFQLLQVLRPLHGNTVRPGEQIHIIDPQGNCFATTVPDNVAPGKPFHVRVPIITSRGPAL